MIASLLPSMIIFDLDFVLWPFWIDNHMKSPFFGKGEKIVDSTGQRVTCYPDVPRILEMLDKRGIRMAVASRITDYKGANQLMDAFDWSKSFTYTVTHPGAVTTHIKQIHLLSGIPYADMLYFNDEPRDLHQVERMGVLTYLVKQGLDLTALRNGFDRYEKNKTRGPFSPAFKPRFRTFNSQPRQPQRPRTDNKYDRSYEPPRHTYDKPHKPERWRFERILKPHKRTFDRPPIKPAESGEHDESKSFHFSERQAL